jgi:DNA-binding CsgD family transcriptional regulator
VRNTVLEREFELSTLEQAVSQLTAGFGSIVVVDAAAGLGKTTLLRRTRDFASAGGSTVLSARCAELERDFAFGVVRQLFDSALPREDRAREKLFSGAAKTSEDLLTNNEGDEGKRLPRTVTSLYLLLNGLYWLLVNLAETAPVVVVVDDIQWADLPSLRFLAFLARRVDSIAVTIVIANRAGANKGTELLGDVLTAGDTIVLEPRNLSETAVSELVRQALGPEADDNFCTACHAVTSGNPLFVRELLRILAARGTRPNANAVASVRSAGTAALQRHVTARLRRQPADVHAVAEAVAVLGDDTALSLIARQSGLPLPVTASAAERLTRAGIFERDDPPAFVHGVVRDIVLELIPLASRAAQHERAATLLQETGEPIARVASHLLRTSPDSNPGRVNILLAAADQARKRGSPGSAAVYLLRARNEPPPPELRSEVSRLLGNCEAHSLAFGDAEMHLREALLLADSPGQRARCAYSLARFRSACDAPGEAVDLLTQALGELPSDQGAGLSAVLQAELIGVTRADLGRRAELLGHLASYQQLPGSSIPVAEAQLSVEAMFAGRPADDVAALAQRALAGDRLPPDRSAIWAAIHALLVADRLDEAERRLNQALDTSVRKGLLFPVALVKGYLARAALLRGDLAEARNHVELGSDGLIEPNVAVPVMHATQVHLLVEDARFSEADAVVRASVLSGGREPSTAWQLWLLGARARLRAAQGAHSAALADALTCERLYRQWGADGMLDVPWRLLAADAHRNLGEHRQAASLVAEQLRLARAFGVPRHIAVALRATAMLAESAAEARRLLQEAVELLKGSPARLELARTLERLGQATLDDGDRRTGLEAVRRAAELAVQCHASMLAERLRARLTANGARAPLLVPTGVHAFTPAERQVADLASAGRTNRQIAEHLFLSEKTVETHLSHAYRKLGVRSRTQLAVQMTTASAGRQPLP